ncbi:hypothetical protein MAR_003568 [Mya arenaria]|uniref:Uncharacterized protein n=1 Tax=Mya arenaria TaxID=6604 RepID=A0ABY7GFK9_MYAAR|nr:hypothetical protein MAR_003549 [Mya arenaria]WAR30000.1 hypothetical protein MAR_003568 [Mya arenaria]
MKVYTQLVKQWRQRIARLTQPRIIITNGLRHLSTVTMGVAGRRMTIPGSVVKGRLYMSSAS